MNPTSTRRSCYTNLAVLPRPIELSNSVNYIESNADFIYESNQYNIDGKLFSAIAHHETKPIASVPTFLIRGPDDCIALIGGTVCLTVEYGGFPEPAVKWLRAVSIRTYLLSTINIMRSSNQLTIRRFL